MAEEEVNNGAEASVARLPEEQGELKSDGLDDLATWEPSTKRRRRSPRPPFPEIMSFFLHSSIVTRRGLATVLRQPNGSHQLD